MDRLTKRRPSEAEWNGENFCENAYSLCEVYDYNCDLCPLDRVLNRLCEYEDTGLEPKTIQLLAIEYINESVNSRNRHG